MASAADTESGGDADPSVSSSSSSSAAATSSMMIVGSPVSATNLVSPDVGGSAGKTAETEVEAVVDGGGGDGNDRVVEDVANDLDRISVDDVSIGSVSGSVSGGAIGGGNNRKNSTTSRSSCGSSLLFSAVLTSEVGPAGQSSAPASTVAASNTAVTTMTTAPYSASSSGSIATTATAGASAYTFHRSLSLSRDGASAPSSSFVDLALQHQYPSSTTALFAPPAACSMTRTSPLVAPPPPPSLPLVPSSSSSTSSATSSCIINLNVGGHTFSTSLSTLVKYEDSMLAVMFSGRHPFSKDREGRYFIDRDGQFFGHILSYLRSDALPPEDAALFVLREAEFFCLQSLIEKLESSSPRVIAARRRDYFRALIPDYDSIKKSIVGVAARKRTTFEESIVVLTQDNHAKLQGSIPCYNCTREPVCVTHDCTFRGNKSDITVKVKTQDINMDKMIGFIVNELCHDGFAVDSNVVLCKFSLRCHSCTMSGLYTAGGILAPRECPNMAHVLTFNW